MKRLSRFTSFLAVVVSTLISVSTLAVQPDPGPHACSTTQSPIGGVPPWVIRAYPFPLEVPTYYPCSGVKGGSSGNPNDCLLSPYAPPFDFIGRVIDSGMGLHDLADGFPQNNGVNAIFAGAAYPLPEMNRIFFHEGSVLGGYELSTFTTQKLNEKMKSRTNVVQGLPGCEYFFGAAIPSSFYNPWDTFDDPESSTSGWQLGISNAHGIRPGARTFDVDTERGYVYHVYGPTPDQQYDLGILKDNGQGQMKLITQLDDPYWSKARPILEEYRSGGLSPADFFKAVDALDSSLNINVDQVVHLRSDDRYFILVGRNDWSTGYSTKTLVYDVTDPSQPKRVVTLANAGFDSLTVVPGQFSPVNAAKILTASGHILATFKSQGNELMVFGHSELTRAGQAERVPVPAARIAAPAGYSFKSIATDGIRFYALLNAGLVFDAQGNIISVPKSKIYVIEGQSALPETFAKTGEKDLTGSFGAGFDIKSMIRYGAGYLTVLGMKYPLLNGSCQQIASCGSIRGYPQVRLFKTSHSGIDEVPTDDYLTKFYVPPRGMPGFEKTVGTGTTGYHEILDSIPFSVGGDAYLANMSLGEGDIYKLGTPPVPSACNAPAPVIPPQPDCDLSSTAQYTKEDSLQFACSGGAILTECKLDSGPWFRCLSQRTGPIPGLTEGGHHLHVRAWDSSFASYDAAPASRRSLEKIHTFVYDITKPIIDTCSFDCTTGKVFYVVRGFLEGTLETNQNVPNQPMFDGLYLHSPLSTNGRTGGVIDNAANLRRLPDSLHDITDFDAVNAMMSGWVPSGRPFGGGGISITAQGPGEYQLTCVAADAAGNKAIVSHGVMGDVPPGSGPSGRYSCP